MDINHDVVFEIEHLQSPVDLEKIENYSHFSAIRLAKKHYEKAGFDVLEGEDFENNLTIYLYDKDKLLYDNYIRVKIGRGTLMPSIAAYSEQVLSSAGREFTDTLLCICRLCAYSGSPGFPDLVVMSNKMELKYVIFDELTTSQKLFLLFAKLLGIGVSIVKVSKSESISQLSINPRVLIESILFERRAKNIIENLDANIAAAKQTAQESGDKAHQDEVEYLVRERRKISLFMLDEFVKTGELSKQDTEDTISFILSNSKNVSFEAYRNDLENDTAFIQLLGNKTEDGMRRKAEYMQKKFSIGQSRSKLMLNFF